jgi:hypothetical protein
MSVSIFQFSVSVIVPSIRSTSVFWGGGESAARIGTNETPLFSGVHVHPTIDGHVRT